MYFSCPTHAGVVLQRRRRMMSLVVTSCGFVVSAIFILFVLARLFCTRMQRARRGFTSGWVFDAAATVDSIAHIERGATGLDLETISLFPTIKYRQHIFASAEDAMCTICLIGYEEKDILRILPGCGHTFHVNCIDAWLIQHSTCPICRVPFMRSMPSPLLTAAARSRFSPGAIPERFFEQPLLLSGMQQHLCNNIEGAMVTGTLSEPKQDSWRLSTSSNSMKQESLEKVSTMKQKCGEESQKNLGSDALSVGVEGEAIDSV